MEVEACTGVVSNSVRGSTTVLSADLCFDEYSLYDYYKIVEDERVEISYDEVVNLYMAWQKREAELEWERVLPTEERECKFYWNDTVYFIYHDGSFILRDTIDEEDKVDEEYDTDEDLDYEVNYNDARGIYAAVNQHNEKLTDVEICELQEAVQSGKARDFSSRTLKNGAIESQFSGYGGLCLVLHNGSFMRVTEDEDAEDVVEDEYDFESYLDDCGQEYTADTGVEVKADGVLKGRKDNKEVLSDEQASARWEANKEVVLSGIYSAENEYEESMTDTEIGDLYVGLRTGVAEHIYTMILVTSVAVSKFRAGRNTYIVKHNGRYYETSEGTQGEGDRVDYGEVYEAKQDRDDISKKEARELFCAVQSKKARLLLNEVQADGKVWSRFFWKRAEYDVLHDGGFIRRDDVNEDCDFVLVKAVSKVHESSEAEINDLYNAIISGAAVHRPRKINRHGGYKYYVDDFIWGNARYVVWHYGALIQRGFIADAVDEEPKKDVKELDEPKKDALEPIYAANLLEEVAGCLLNKASFWYKVRIDRSDIIFSVSATLTNLGNCLTGYKPYQQEDRKVYLDSRFVRVYKMDKNSLTKDDIIKLFVKGQDFLDKESRAS